MASGIRARFHRGNLSPSFVNTITLCSITMASIRVHLLVHQPCSLPSPTGMAHLLRDAHIRKLKVRINALEERMDVPALQDGCSSRSLGKNVHAHKDWVEWRSTSIQDTVRLATKPLRELGAVYLYFGAVGGTECPSARLGARDQGDPACVPTKSTPTSAHCAIPTTIRRIAPMRQSWRKWTRGVPFSNNGIEQGAQQQAPQKCIHGVMHIELEVPTNKKKQMLQEVLTKLLSSFFSFPNKAGELQPPTRTLELSGGRFVRPLGLEVNTREVSSVTWGVATGSVTRSEVWCGIFCEFSYGGQGLLLGQPTVGRCLTQGKLAKSWEMVCKFLFPHFFTLILTVHLCNFASSDALGHSTSRGK
ncbi:unnamed protein product [Citrullus colocynthis]|uniref:Uncharacterized protein n=1 Tax=Citrullus colocynthis TaxID=252529 RepID=A0ABP0XPE8_9ROSI